MEKYQFGEIKRADLDTSSTLPTTMPNISFLPTEDRVSPFGQYDTGMTYQADQQKLRAYNQPFSHELGIGALNTVNNILPATLESLSMLPSLFMDSRNARTFNEGIQKAYEPFKNQFSQGLYGDNQIYTEDDGRAYALKNIFGIVESGASFIGTGGVIGAGLKGLSKLAQAKHIAGALNLMSKSKGANNLRAAVNTMNNLRYAGQNSINAANTFLTSSVEGQLNGLEASNTLKEKYKHDYDFRMKVKKFADDKGISELEAFNRMLDTAYATTANISTMVGVPLNYSGLSALLTPSSALKAYRKSAGSLFTGEFTETALERGGVRRLQDVLKESGQEALEEGLQSVAGKIGEERAVEGKEKVGLFNYLDMFKAVEESGQDLVDGEFWESAMWGALGGTIQSGAINAVGAIANDKKTYDNNKKAYEFLKQDFLKSVDKVSNLKTELDGLMGSINNETDFRKHEERINEIKTEIFDTTIRESLKKGKTDLLINDLKEFIELDENKTEKEILGEELDNLIDEAQDEIIAIQQSGEENPDRVAELQEMVDAKRKEFENASDFSLPKLYNLEHGYKVTAQEKVQELEDMQREFNQFSSYFPELNERQRLNTVDLYLDTKKRDKKLKQLELKQNQIDTQLLESGLEEIESLTSEDFEEGVDIEQEKQRLRQGKVDQRLIDQREDLIEEIQQMNELLEIKSSKEYYNQISDYDADGTVTTNNKVRETLVREKLLDDIKKAAFDQIYKRNKFIKNKEAVFESSLDNVEAIRNATPYATTAEEKSKIESAINERIVTLKKEFLDSIEQFKDTDGNYNIEIMGIPLFVAGQDVQEALSDPDHSAHNELRALGSEEIAEEIKELEQLKEELPNLNNKEPKLKSELKVAEEFINENISSIETNLDAITDDLASLNKEKKRLRTLKQFLEKQTQYEIEFDLTSLEQKLNKKEKEVLKLLDKSEQEELQKWSDYKTNVNSDTNLHDNYNNAQTIFLNELPLKFHGRIVPSVAGMARFLQGLSPKEDFELSSQFYPSDEFSEDNPSVVPIKKALKAMIPVEATRYVEGINFIEHFTEEIPFPEQLIAIQQGVYSLLKSDRNVLLQGLAGTGKTSVVAKYIFKILRAQGRDVSVIGIGSRVHKQLNEKLLGQTTDQNPVEYWEKYLRDIKKGSIVLIDEAPKLNHAQVSILMQIAEENNLTLFFTGDPRQITGNDTLNYSTILPTNPVILTPLTQTKRSAHPSIIKYQEQFTKDKLEKEFSYEVQNSKAIEGVKKITNVETEIYHLDKENTAIIAEDPAKYDNLKKEGWQVYSIADTQGLEWDNVVLDLEQAENRSKYVAASRAKKLILSIDPGIKENPSSIYETKDTDLSRFEKNEKWFNTEFGIERTDSPEVKEETSNEEELIINNSLWSNFVETGEVPKSIFNKIIDKIKKSETLSTREQAIANDKIQEINEALVAEQESETNDQTEQEKQVEDNTKEEVTADKTQETEEVVAEEETSDTSLPEPVEDTPTVEQSEELVPVYANKIAPVSKNIKLTGIKQGSTVVGIPVKKRTGEVVMNYYAQNPNRPNEWLEVGQQKLKTNNFKDNQIYKKSARRISTDDLKAIQDKLDKSEYTVNKVSPMISRYNGALSPMNDSEVRQEVQKLFGKYKDSQEDPIISEKAYIHTSMEIDDSTKPFQTSKLKKINNGATFVRYTSQKTFVDIEVHGQPLSRAHGTIQYIFEQRDKLKRVEESLDVAGFPDIKWGDSSEIDLQVPNRDMYYTKAHMFDAMVDAFIYNERSYLFEQKQGEITQAWESLTLEQKTLVEDFIQSLYYYDNVNALNNNNTFQNRQNLKVDKKKRVEGKFSVIEIDGQEVKRRLTKYTFNRKDNPHLRGRSLELKIDVVDLLNHQFTIEIYDVTGQKERTPENKIWSSEGLDIIEASSLEELQQVGENIVLTGKTDPESDFVKKSKHWGPLQKAFADMVMPNSYVQQGSGRFYFKQSTGDTISDVPISLYNNMQKRRKLINGTVDEEGNVTDGEWEMVDARSVLDTFLDYVDQGELFTPIESDFLNSINNGNTSIQELYNMTSTRFRNFENSILELDNGQVSVTPTETIEQDFDERIQEILNSDQDSDWKIAKLNTMTRLKYLRKNNIKTAEAMKSFKKQVEKALKQLTLSSKKEQDTNKLEDGNEANNEC